MTGARPSVRLSAALATLACLPPLAACPSATPSTSSAPTIARREDPQPYLPPPTRGPLRSGATVGLFASVTEDDVITGALAFLRAWITEDIDALMELISEDFSPGNGGRTISRRVLREAWQRQFARLDYTQFTVDEVVDREQIEVGAFGELHSRRSQQRGLRSGDLLVRLRMRVTQRNRRRYFDDVLELWFRRQRGRWLIVAMGD